jgi:hypothetical protein
MVDQITALDYEIAAQFAHFGMAGFIVSQLGRLGWEGLLIGSIGMVAFAAVKEFGYDIHHENPLVRGSSVLDFFMYAAGVATAVGLWFIR